MVRELKMTQYNNTVKTCAIGSRDQLCINPQIMTQKNYTTKMNMCKAKVNTKTCFFHNNIESKEFINHIQWCKKIDISRNFTSNDVNQRKFT